MDTLKPLSKKEVSTCKAGNFITKPLMRSRKLVNFLQQIEDKFLVKYEEKIITFTPLKIMAFSRCALTTKKMRNIISMESMAGSVK